MDTKEPITLTKEEMAVVSSKTGYTECTIFQILRGYVKKNSRHAQIWALYEKISYLRKLHKENYLKDLQNL